MTSMLIKYGQSLSNSHMTQEGSLVKFCRTMTLNVDQIWPKSNQIMYDPGRFSGKILVDILPSILLVVC